MTRNDTHSDDQPTDIADRIRAQQVQKRKAVGDR